MKFVNVYFYLGELRTMAGTGPFAGDRFADRVSDFIGNLHEPFIVSRPEICCDSVESTCDAVRGDVDCRLVDLPDR